MSLAPRLDGFKLPLRSVGLWMSIADKQRIGNGFQVTFVDYQVGK